MWEKMEYSAFSTKREVTGTFDYVFNGVSTGFGPASG